MAYSTQVVSLCLVLGTVIQLCTGYTCVYYSSGYRYELTCASGECCGPAYDRYCCTYYSPGAIAGSVIGFIIFVCIISAITCCFCSCCPVYQRRQDVIISTAGGPHYGAATTVTTVNQGPYTAKPEGGYTAPPPYQQI